ncbi:MAG: hypothetical protein ACE145_13670 [Terriglobia bacterium]
MPNENQPVNPTPGGSTSLEPGEMRVSAARTETTGDALSMNDLDFETPAPAPKSTPQAQPVKSAEEMSDEEVERQWVKQTFGAEPEEIKEIVAEKRAEKAARSFITEHQADYTPTPRNFALIDGFLQENNLPMTRENLEQAHQALENQFEKAPARPVAPRKPASSGISDSDHAAAPVGPQTAEGVITEAYNMPLAQLRQTIQNRAYASRAGKPVAPFHKMSDDF